LFAEARQSDEVLRRQTANVPAAERAAMLRDPAQAKDFYLQAKSFYLAVSPETASLLYMLTRATSSRSVIEFGTSFGISTLHIAAALRDNGGGRVITSEFEPSKAAKARENFAAAGLAKVIELREGDALQTLATDLPESVDLLLLDGAKVLYPAVLDLVESRLRPGSLIVADNADWSPEYLDVVRNSGRYVSVPFAEDVELSMKI
jgi:predicted O-methyltransferase YrrM